MWPDQAWRCQHMHGRSTIYAWFGQRKTDGHLNNEQLRFFFKALEWKLLGSRGWHHKSDGQVRAHVFCVVKESERARRSNYVHSKPFDFILPWRVLMKIFTHQARSFFRSLMMDILYAKKYETNVYSFIPPSLFHFIISLTLFLCLISPSQEWIGNFFCPFLGRY